MGKRWKDAEDFKGAVERWALRVGVKVREVHLRPMRSKWASYSVATGRMTFDTGLLENDRKFGEYVILHELLHLRIPNHGRLFKGFLSSYMPGWERLAKNAPSIEGGMEGMTGGG
jgi:hypothetical protein